MDRQAEYDMHREYIKSNGLDKLMKILSIRPAYLIQLVEL